MGKYSNKFQRYIKMELSKAKNGAKEETGEVADKEDHGVLEVNIYMKDIVNLILSVV